MLSRTAEDTAEWKTATLWSEDRSVVSIDGILFDGGSDRESHSADVGERLLGYRYSVIKGGFDRLCALGLIAALAVPGLVIAAAIRLDSKGPVFFREWRVGKNGRRFLIWKFRSMKANECAALYSASPNALDGRVIKAKKDARVTAVGAFLRSWSLDEFPQLFNVLRGDMSLVGPRPVIDQEVALYGKHQSSYLAAKPGMSGLWQVSGRCDLSFDKRAELDALYVSSWSLRRDFEILLRTIPAVIQRTGAR